MRTVGWIPKTFHWRFGMTNNPGPDALLASSANVDQTSCARSCGFQHWEGYRNGETTHDSISRTLYQEHAHTHNIYVIHITLKEKRTQRKQTEYIKSTNQPSKKGNMTHTLLPHKIAHNLSFEHGLSLMKGIKFELKISRSSSPWDGSPWRRSWIDWSELLPAWLMVLHKLGSWLSTQLNGVKWSLQPLKQ